MESNLREKTAQVPAKEKRAEATGRRPLLVADYLTLSPCALIVIGLPITYGPGFYRSKLKLGEQLSRGTWRDRTRSPTTSGGFPAHSLISVVL